MGVEKLDLLWLEIKRLSVHLNFLFTRLNCCDAGVRRGVDRFPCRKAGG